MKHRDEVLGFDVGGERLLGILSRPEVPSDTALLVVVGGPQYRVGSHRQFVQLARTVAAAGHAVLRFDVRGMGDSSGALHTFEHISDDIGAALDALQAAMPHVRRVALWGLCDGASAALLYVGARQDARVEALVLLNPWVRSVASHARAQVRHYYLQRLTEKAFWRKVLRGQVGPGALSGLLGSVSRAIGWHRGGQPANDGATAPFQQRMASAWQHFPGRLMLILSGQDLTAREFLDHVSADPHWAGALQRTGLVRRDLLQADHTFSDAEASATVEQSTVAFLNRADPGATAPGPARQLALQVEP